MAGKNTVLLPSGLYDLLPPEARKESQAVAHLLARFESFGYAQVSPPLLEFESTLLSGRGEALAQQTFRVMDPISQTMMGLRPDITMQVARIASSRLAGEPRPLRLCYAGPILQLKPEALKSERQLTQAGIELIGTDSASADAEVMAVAAGALTSLGIKDITIDINLPGLLGELCHEVRDNKTLRGQVKDAVLRKDASAIAALPIANSKKLTALMDAAGPLDKGLAALAKLKLPEAKLIKDVAARVRKNAPQVTLTLDPIEYRGFNYHQGISFSIFAKGLRHELGRGGRYQVNGESATGFTLYVTHLLRLLGTQETKKRILVPQNASAKVISKLQLAGWTTLYALTTKLRDEAKRLRCTHILTKEKVQAL